MKHLMNYSAAPDAEKFYEVSARELAEIRRKIEMDLARVARTGDGAEYDEVNTDLGAATRAAELMGSEGLTVLVAEDEDGYYFATQSLDDLASAALMRNRFVLGGTR